MRLSLPFSPLFGVASFMAVSKEEVQTQDRGSFLEISSMVSSMARLLGVWRPLYRTIVVSVLGSQS